VKKIRAVIEGLGKEIATPADARSTLALRGATTTERVSNGRMSLKGSKSA
jgi:hypothetical protein